MTRNTGALVAFLAAVLVGVGFSDRSEWRVAAQEDPHAYFNALVRRADHWKSWSLRDPAQTGTRQWVTYNPAADTDRHRQDAAKVVVPTFYETSYLTQALAANATILSVESTAGGLFPRDRVIRIDSEIMTVVTAPTSSTVQVTRGSFGTQVVPHASGAIISHATNSLRSQLRLPLGTEDGHDYFFVWESYWTDSFIGAGRFNHKAFQFSSGSRDGDQIWLEPQVSYGRTTQPCMNPSVASFQVRSYNQLGGDANWLLSDGNQLGPGATASPSLGPRANFCVEANRWVRFFLHLRQRANDYDPVDVWVADETRDPIQVVMNSPVSVRPTGGTPNSIAKFWIEFNSSEDDYLRVDGRDLVAYVRNFVALRDVGDPRSLLVRPVPGAAPVSGPAPPTNVRLLK